MTPGVRKFCRGTCVASVRVLKVHTYFKFLIENTTSTVKMFSLLYSYKITTFLFSIVFTARCYVSALLAMDLCPSVRPSQIGVLLKRQNVGSHKQHHTIPQGFQFSAAKELREIRPGSPLRGRQMQVWWIKIGDFRQITGYISKTGKKIGT